MPVIRPWHAAIFAACLPYIARSLEAQDRYGSAINRSIVRAADVRADSARETDVLESVEACKPAVAHVFVEITERGNTFKIERPSTGVFVDATGLFVTFWSLVREAYDGTKMRAKHGVRIQTRDGKRHEAELVARDEKSDLALLRVRSSEESPIFPSLELADTRALRPGDASLVLSYHDGKEDVAFAGVVGRPLGPTEHRGRRLAPSEFWITDAAIEKRNHGGPVIDAQRRLIGLASAEHIAAQVREPELKDVMRTSYGFCLPVDAIRALCRKHLKRGDASNETLFEAPKEARKHEAIADAVEKARRSIVCVWSGDGTRPPEAEGDPLASRRVEARGSGVIVSSDGLVVTNLHLMTGGTSTRVLLAGKSYPARLVGTHKSSNTALLRIEVPSSVTLHPIAMASSQHALLGETVIGIGDPSGTGRLSVSAGILSAKRGRNALQADPNLGNANGGGALLDLAGRMIGIVDGGRMDKRELAFRRRGDRSKVQSNLSMVTGTDGLRRFFDELGGLEMRAKDEGLTARRSAVAKVAEDTAKGLLNIYVSRSSRAASDDDNPFAPARVVTMTRGLGSGVVIDDSGLAISNWHVVDEATRADGSMARDHVVHARLRDGTTCECEVLSISREDDLALLRLRVPEGREIRAVQLGDSDAMKVGETAIAVGNPEGRANSVTCGILSSKDRSIKIRGRWDDYRGLLETDAAINGGNSGGALLDLDGRLIGINSAGGGGFSVTGFAIPVNHVRTKLLNLLLSPAKLRSSYVGMTYVDDEGPGKTGALRLTAVDMQGPAKRAGLQVGDRVLALDGAELRWSVDLTMRILERKGGDTLRFTISRGGKRMEKKLVCLGASTWAVQKQLGVEIEAVTAAKESELVRNAAIAMHRRYAGDPTANPSRIPDALLRVTRVTRGEHELKKGDLVLAFELENEALGGALKRFTSARQLQTSIDELSTYEGRVFTLWIYRDGEVKVVRSKAKRLLL